VALYQQQQSERATARQAEAARRAAMRRQREADRERRRERADAAARTSIVDTARRQREGGFRVPVHCGDYVADGGRVYTSDAWRTRERERQAHRALPAHKPDE
jgi:hypothetical protein